MTPVGEPSNNALVQSGYVTNEAGRVFEAPCGPLELPWLVDVSREKRRRARERFGQSKAVTPEERFSWFIASTESEFKGLRFLLEKDWRRALKAWQGSGQFQVHNRATLHRALFYSKHSQRPDAHLRECLRLYHHLSELDPSQSLYRTFQEELLEHLKQSIRDAETNNDDQSAAKSLRLLAQTVGLATVGHLQEQFFRAELDDFRLQCAKLQKDLLSYQGLAHKPPEGILEKWDNELTRQILPRAARLSHKLVEGSTTRNEVESLAAQACGVMAQSYVKADDPRGGKKWVGEALRWEPSAVTEWRDLPEDWGEDDAAEVKFPEKKKEVEESPVFKGNLFCGLRPVTVKRQAGEAREEHLESIFLAFLPVFPTRRFAAYRNLDTGEIGYYLRIPMTVLDHVRQGVMVLLLTIVLTVGIVRLHDWNRGPDGPGPVVSAEEARRLIGAKVEDLAELARREATLAGKDTLTPPEEERLQEIRRKRAVLIKELEELEKSRSR